VVRAAAPNRYCGAVPAGAEAPCCGAGGCVGCASAGVSLAGFAASFAGGATGSGNGAEAEAEAAGVVAGAGGGVITGAGPGSVVAVTVAAGTGAVLISVVT
jgi:hypothetical protein